MRILITGGTGFIGKNLANHLISMNYKVTVISRSLQKARETFGERVSILEADPATPGEWQHFISKHHVIINLAGKNIYGRWTKKLKAQIRDSRINITRNIVEGIKDQTGITLINASAIGYYGSTQNTADEYDEARKPGRDFLAKVCMEWEREAIKAESSGNRVLLLRLGVVLGKDGGSLKRILPIFKYGLGGRIGNGKQYLSWVHIKDVIYAVQFFISHPSLKGAFNITAPNPVTNREFTKILSKKLKRPAIMPIPVWMLQILYGKEFGLFLSSGQKVIPKRLTMAGFKFLYEDINQAIHDILCSQY